MKSARAAFQNLVSLAAADGEISREERELIERYRLALGLSKDAWNDVGGVAELAQIEGPPAERVHVGVVTSNTRTSIMTRRALRSRSVRSSRIEW